MKHLLAVVLSAYSVLISAQPLTWREHNVFDLAILEFPCEPECLDTLGQHICRCENGLGQFVAIVINIDNQAPVNDKDLSDLYRGVTTSMAEKSGARVSEQEDFFYKNMRGIEFTLSNEDYSYNRYHKVLNLGPNTILCVYTPTSDDAQAVLKAKNHFFKSFVVTAEPSRLSNAHSRIGELIGAVFVVAVVITGIFLLVYLSNRRR